MMLTDLSSFISIDERLAFENSHFGEDGDPEIVREEW
jgi:hypothetical protein